MNPCPPQKLVPGKHRVRGRKALSLVEVVMAIGIVSFGLLLLVALLPVGLDSVEQGKTEEVAAELLNGVAIELRSRSLQPGSRTALSGLEISNDEIVKTFDYAGRPLATDDDKSYFRLNAVLRDGVASSKGDWWHLRLEWPSEANQPNDYVESVVLVPAPPENP